MKRILFLIAVVLGVSLAAQAQSSYSFTCDTYDQNGQCTYRNLHGVIKVTTDADGIYCLLAEVDKPAEKEDPYHLRSGPIRIPSIPFLIVAYFSTTIRCTMYTM